MERLDSVGIVVAGAGANSGAAQLTLALPAEHDQVHGPEPNTALALPAAQRLAVGALLTATPLAVPHAAATTTNDAAFATIPQLASMR